MQQNVSVKSVLQTLRQSFYIVGYKVARLFIQQERGLVLFLSDSHDTLVNNQAVVARELQARGYTVKSVLKDGLRARRSIRSHIELCGLLAKAPVIVVDDYYPMIYQIKLRPDTQLLQLWHASGAFKTMGFSREGKPGGPIKGSKTHKNYTSAIVSSQGVRANYAQAFGISLDKVHATGIPRTDVFFDKELVASTSERIRAELNIPSDKKLLLFAPTFRGNSQLSAHYNEEWIDWEELARVAGDEYVIGFKPHPFVKTIPNMVTQDPRFRDLRELRDANALLMATDLLVTDYSSIIFDFAFLNRPTIFFCPDLEEYVAARDFYYPFEKYTFGPVARTSQELTTAIAQGVVSDDKLEEFVDFFCGACDGTSTTRVIDTLIAPFAGAPETVIGQ